MASLWIDTHSSDDASIDEDQATSVAKPGTISTRTGWGAKQAAELEILKFFTSFVQVKVTFINLLK